MFTPTGSLSSPIESLGERKMNDTPLSVLRQARLYSSAQSHGPTNYDVDHL